MTKFAEACYEQNSIEELIAEKNAVADSADMETWNITETEWRTGILEALKEKMADKN